ncbi:malto-oligosyltrehalose synthase [Taibaiella helva]|uniref:malto-oligosyltrehalose synthase n=1 Tax=Taibaiella helva TaxID=2301235 RepID=UPI000E595FF9|nr:malto-oligosyltrehalose synthase [Taibaiella helva]
MYLPEATYRVQLNKEFTFAHLRAIIPYLHQLGISTIYASPIFAAVPGSRHGYDGIDPNAINPEIGTLGEFREMAAELKQRGMGWLQDFVPNHMAYTPLNPWICDFLEKGKMSFYDHYFDKNPDEPLMAPFLGQPFPDVLAAGELKIVYEKGRLYLRYFEACYPLNYTAYGDILYHELFDDFPFLPVRRQLDILSQVTDSEGFQDAWELLLNHLEWSLADTAVAARFAAGLEVLSENKDLLQRLCEQQFYRLCHWKETDTRINYRRFFTINSLIGINIQHAEVFRHYHRLLFQLIEEGLVQGIRIDHIDGLYDPGAYLEQLREHTGDDVYIVVEKILETEESLPALWPVQGTTGYDFLATVNQVLTDSAAEAAFTAAYATWAPGEGSVQEQMYAYKRRMLEEHMQGELENLLRLWKAIPGMQQPASVSDHDLKALLTALLACCPVYRFYPQGLPFVREEQEDFDKLLSLAGQTGTVSSHALTFFEHCFSAGALSGLSYRERLLRFWRRFMQLSGPLMAKGVEDTLMYNYMRFPAHNEVGDTPAAFGMPVSAFHERMEKRQATTPFALNATATHDTKRGEEARARLRRTSYDVAGWQAAISEWMDMAKSNAANLSPKDQYTVLLAVYGSLSPEGSEADFAERLSAYLRKAAREAKHHSSWDKPDEAYEHALIRYGLAVADQRSGTGMAMRRYLRRQQAGIERQSLSQLVLKCTCPGIPDIYQGAEYPDLSFVDPDNRRPVNYTDRAVLLQRVAQKDFSLAQLSMENPAAIKLFCMHRLLQWRRSCPELFHLGTYEPLPIDGPYLSFLRRYGRQWLWVMIPLDDPVTATVRLPGLPPGAPRQWTSLFTGKTMASDEPDIAAQLAAFPVAVFTADVPDPGRNAGILLPLFALPSARGIGTLGREAFDWIRFLAGSGQRLWQLLPLNPISHESAYSPYAAVSAFAGEPLYLDLEQLADEGLLPRQAIREVRWPTGDRVDYKVLIAQQRRLLRQAWQVFGSGNIAVLRRDFAQFCWKQTFWLEDYALYVVLKRKQENQAWYEWPEPLRDRHYDVLEAVKKEESEAIAFEQWLQFLFFRQWARLKRFAAQYGVALMGDLPFYMDHDSADVWVHRQCFMVDEEGRKTAQAGVPPDYFSETGQLWGMPTYNWEALREAGFGWWLQRLAANTERYDLVRLDHFRAFYDYWELPGDALTATDGAWLPGPQALFFDLLQQHFPHMPFIAEDLGEIHQGVFAFKDHYRLPGMRVLQFAFNPYLPGSRDLPHNFDRPSIAYTGTHDNDTTLGWYEQLGAQSRKDLSAYAGFAITKDNVAEALCRMAYASVACAVVLPAQDLLGLGVGARINTPSTTDGNWVWRLKQLPAEAVMQRLREWTQRYNR